MVRAPPPSQKLKQIHPETKTNPHARIIKNKRTIKIITEK
jgi:hypothetical protein